MKTKFLYYLLMCCLNTMVLSAQVQIGQDIQGEDVDDQFGQKVVMNQYGSIVAIGGLDHSEGFGAGVVRVYFKDGSDWTQLGEDLSGGGFFGQTMAINNAGNRLIIGAYFLSSNGTQSGQVKVFEFINENWAQLGQELNGDSPFDFFGFNVTMNADGSQIAVGAITDDGNGVDSGQVKAYNLSNDVWVPLGQEINGAAAGDWHGYSLDLASNKLAIGAIHNGTNGVDSGQVRIFALINQTWSQLGGDINGEAPYDLSGIQIALDQDGDTVAIGAIENDGNGSGSGHVRVYRYMAGNWTQIGMDLDGAAAGDICGSSVDLDSSGNIVAVGSRQNDGNGSHSGHARIFQYDGSDWVQMGDDIEGAHVGDWSAYSLALDKQANHIIIGSPKNDGNGTSSGHARIFDLSGILETEQFSQNIYTVYPNPATDLIHIGGTTIPLQARMYNSIGQMVFEGSLTDRFSVGSFPAGIYMLLLSDGKRTDTHRIIKH